MLPHRIHSQSPSWGRRTLVDLGLPLVIALLLVAPSRNGWPASPCPASPAPGTRGEFGGDLAFLARCYVPPAAPAESNHFMDLWNEPGFHQLVAGSGLTNNRALFVNSHGTALRMGKQARYALFPHESRWPSGSSLPNFSVADLVQVIGHHRAAEIHNIIVGGCNEEGAFSAQEFRAHFVNATNITHMAAGDLGCQPMLLQALMTGSENVQSIYESSFHHTGIPRQFVTTTNKPKRSAIRFKPYIAELFQPGATFPFKTQVAGRELLDPAQTPLPDLATLLAEQNP